MLPSHSCVSEGSPAPRGKAGLGRRGKAVARARLMVKGRSCGEGGRIRRGSGVVSLPWSSGSCPCGDTAVGEMDYLG